MNFSLLVQELKREERVALIGNNGTGKTTILKLINGLLLPDRGEIKLGGFSYGTLKMLHPDMAAVSSRNKLC